MKQLLGRLCMFPFTRSSQLYLFVFQGVGNRLREQSHEVARNDTNPLRFSWFIFFYCAVNSYSEPPMETHIKHVPPVL